MIASIPRIAVLGAGTMGPGIAAAFASAGHSASIWSRKPERADAGVKAATELTRFLSETGLAIADVPGEERLAPAPALDDVAGADVVIEAVAEELDAKRALLAQVDELLPPDRLIATNTSGLRVTDVAAPLRHPERVVAMHFWNPAHLMPLVEIAGGEETADDA